MGCIIERCDHLKTFEWTIKDIGDKIEDIAKEFGLRYRNNMGHRCLALTIKEFRDRIRRSHLKEKFQVCGGCFRILKRV